MKNINKYQQCKSYITLDGSEIRELMHPNLHCNKNQSLAEATIKPGDTTALHRHTLSEELYFITQGDGKMQLGDESFSVTTGDSICILPGTPHQIQNTGQTNLIILCCCSPAYSHSDTKII